MLLTIYNLPKYMRYDEIKKLIKEKCGTIKMVLDDLILESGGKRVTVGVTDEADAAILSRNLNGLYMDGHQLFIEASKRNSTSYQAPNYQGSGSYENVGYPQSQQGQQQQLQPPRGYDARSAPTQNYSYSQPPMQTQFGSQQNWGPGPSADNVQQPYNQNVWINQPYPSPAPLQSETGVKMPAPQRESRRDYTQNRPGHGARSYKSPPRETYQSQSSQRTPHDMNAADKFPGSNQQFRNPRDRSPIRGSQNLPQLMSFDAGMGGMTNAPHSDPRVKHTSSTMRSYSSPPRGNQNQSSNNPVLYNMNANQNFLGHDQSVGPSFRMPNFNEHGAHPNRNAAENVYKREDRSDRQLPSAPNFSGQGQPRYQNPVEGSHKMPSRNTMENLSQQSRFDKRPPSMPNFSGHPRSQSPIGGSRNMPPRNAVKNENLSNSRFDRPTNPSFDGPQQSRGQNFSTNMPHPPSGSNYNMTNRAGRETNRQSQYQQRSNDHKQGPNFAPNKNYNEDSKRNQFSGQPGRFDRREVSDKHSGPKARSPNRFANKRGNDGPRVNVSSSDSKKRRNDNDYKPKGNQNQTQQKGRNGSALLTRSEYNAGKGKDSEKRLQRRHINYRQQAYGIIVREMAQNVGDQTYFDDKPLKIAARELIMSRFDAVIKNMLQATFDEIVTTYRKSYPVTTDREFLDAIRIEADAIREGIERGETTASVPKRAKERKAAAEKITQEQTAPGQPPAGLLPKYPNADKSAFKEMKKARVQETQGDVYQLPEPEQVALQKEIEEIKDLIKKTCEDISPENAQDGVVSKMIIDKHLGEITKMIDLSVTKRILNVKNNLILLIYGKPHFPHRQVFENYLKGYGVIALKKSARAMFYVATCDTYQNYDKLCALQTTKLDGMTLKFTPHQLGGPRVKLPKKTKSVKTGNNPNEELESELLALQADAEYDIQDLGDLEEEDFNEEDVNDEQFYEDINVDDDKSLKFNIDNIDETVDDDKLLGIDNMDESVVDDNLLGITDNIDESVDDDKLMGINIENIDENDLEDY